MHYRYTIEDLKNRSDMWLLHRLVQERISSVTNTNSPLAKRLKHLLKKIEDQEELSCRMQKGTSFEDD